MELICHPDTPPWAITAISVACERFGGALRLTYRVHGDIGQLALAKGAGGRADELWRHTCFEAFVADAGPGYREFNFAPSGAWAAYSFDGYRSGMRDADATPIPVWRDEELTVEVAVGMPGDWSLNLTAVIEEVDGTRSYWALAHPDGPPDFHDPACFVLSVPATG